MKVERDFINLTVHREYPDGSPVIREVTPTPFFTNQEPRTKLVAFDSIGQNVFGDFNLFGSNYTDGESQGWEYSVLERQKGLPVTVRRRKIGKSASEALYEGFVQVIAEQHGVTIPPKDIIKDINQELHYQYDEAGRPLTVLTYEKVTTRPRRQDSVFMIPVEEQYFHYDGKGRLRAREDYGYRHYDTGEKYLSKATLCQYQETDEKTRVIRYEYDNVGWKELQLGARPNSITVSDIERTIENTTAQAHYRDERDFHRDDPWMGTLTHYDIVKKYPDTLRFYRQEPPQHQTRPNTYQRLPQHLDAPSYITEQSLQEFVKSPDINKIGIKPRFDNPTPPLYFREFLHRVETTHDDEQALQLAFSVMNGDLSVNMFTPYAKFGASEEEVQNHLLDYARKMRTLTDAQRIAVLSHYCPLCIKNLRTGMQQPAEVIDQLKQFSNILMGINESDIIALKQRLEASSSLKPEGGIVLDLLSDLERFPSKITQNPFLFPNLGFDE